MNPDISDLDPLSNYNVFESFTNTNNGSYSYGSQLANGTTDQSILNNANGTNPSPTVVKQELDFKGKVKIDGRAKNMSAKISQKDFPFYGCSVCNICFATLSELDTHVIMHKNRITSYDLRIKNQLQKKKLKKDIKKKKKIKKIVKMENELLELEIKPEDGYIGSEKTSEVLNTVNGESKENKDCKDIESNIITAVSNSLTLAETIAKRQELLNLQKIYKCFACQKQFTLSYYLKLHVRSHTDEKPYTCAECGQSFITASKLGRHNKRFHLDIRYQCRICYRYFSRFEFLTKHFDNKHPDDKLDGEPYDYNAILPYLKELEEQLMEKQEQEKEKPKSEDLWSSSWPNMGSSGNIEENSLDEKKSLKNESGSKDQNSEIDSKVELIKKELKNEPEKYMEVAIEEVKVSMDEIEIKVEVENTGDDNIADNDDDDVKNESDDAFKDENASDEDYFPKDTWTEAPKSDPVVAKPKVKDDGRNCPVCKKQISTPSYMRIHMRTHTGEKPFKCYICNMGFITSSKMHRHVLTHPESWQEDGIKNEVKSEDEGGDKVLDKKARRKKALQKFAKTKSGKKKNRRDYQKRPHACEFCHKRFLHLETLQVHKKSHDGEALIYKCNFCLTELPDDEALKTHEATHVGPRPYMCTTCGKCYTKKETMVYHRKNHKPEREFICDVCTKSFNAQCKLQRHLASHRAGRFVLRYECPVCAHMFNTRYHVQMHLATHQKEGLIQEENRNEILAMVLQNARKIPKLADAPSSLTDTVPSDERSRVCNICGQVFQHFYYLEEHLKSHGSTIAIEDSEKTEEKKHVCKVCNKGFKLHYYLKLHSFTHTKEKPFICQQCGKGFITRGKLKRHLETHTGLKKYQCHICYKFFTRPSYLRIHVRTIHGTQDYNFRFDGVRLEGDYSTHQTDS